MSGQFGRELDELIFAGEGEEQYSERFRGVDVATAYSYTNPRERFEQYSVARLSYDNGVSGEVQQKVNLGFRVDSVGLTSLPRIKPYHFKN